MKGRTVQINAKILEGRIEDLLRLTIKGKEPLLTGNVSLQSDFTLPPGEADVVERIRLKGAFDLSSAEFTSGAVRAKLRLGLGFARLR